MFIKNYETENTSNQKSTSILSNFHKIIGFQNL
jgi:hypothetical protein